MKSVSRYEKLRMVTKLRVSVWCALFFVLLLPPLKLQSAEENTKVLVYVGDTPIGVTVSSEHAWDLYRRARQSLMQEKGGIFYADPVRISTEPVDSITADIVTDETITEAFRTALNTGVHTNRSLAYQIKVNGVLVSVASAEDARRLLQETIGAYDLLGGYEVSLVQDSSREFSVLVPLITQKESAALVTEEKETPVTAGAASLTEEVEASSDEEEEIGFDSFDYGITEMAFSEPIEITEAYLTPSQIMDYETAKNRLTGLQEEQQIYTIKSGDTLSGISLEVGLPLERLIELNDALENENSLIMPDQELIITVPQPELSVIWTETSRYDEVYDLPTEYVYNEDWYTNQQETLQQPSAGYRNAVTEITRRNDKEIDRAVLYEVVEIEAVAKRIEVGTIAPPTFIRPLSGGRITSGFGSRNAPMAGASTNHKGVDIGTPIGTTIYASSGGTVEHAGWAAGYGYLVTINHPNGMQTRYAHLSKVYVSVGQYVSQGQVIAASGNTGNSTGPHLHFEVRVNGVAYDPRNYVNF